MSVLPDPLRTRDRRHVTGPKVDAATGEISGVVPMIGACLWRSDGRILKSPQMTFSGEQAGPLDLVLDAPAVGEGPKHGSIAAALADPKNQGGSCCD